MSQNTDIKSLDALEASGVALKTAQDFAATVNQEKRAAAALAPGMVDALVANHLIEDHDRAACSQKLASHDGVMEIVGNLVSYIGRQKVAYEQKLAINGNGAPITEKSASVNGGAGNYGNQPGRRLGLGEKSAADVNFINAFGLGGQLGTEGMSSS